VASTHQMRSICQLISWQVSSTEERIHHLPRAAAHRIEWSLSYCAYCWHANRWRSSCVRAFQPAANVHLNAPSPELEEGYDGDQRRSTLGCCLCCTSLPSSEGSRAGEVLFQMSFYARAFAKCPTERWVRLMICHASCGKMF